MSRYGKSVDDGSEYDTRHRLLPELGYSQSVKNLLPGPQLAPLKIDYMSEIRVKYNLAEKTNKFRKLE